MLLASLSPACERKAGDRLDCHSSNPKSSLWTPSSRNPAIDSCRYTECCLWFSHSQLITLVCYQCDPTNWSSLYFLDQDLSGRTGLSLLYFGHGLAYNFFLDQIVAAPPNGQQVVETCHWWTRSHSGVAADGAKLQVFERSRCLWSLFWKVLTFLSTLSPLDLVKPKRRNCNKLPNSSLPPSLLWHSSNPIFLTTQLSFPFCYS